MPQLTPVARIRLQAFNTGVTFREHCIRSGIIAFCLVHMAAVWLYTLPGSGVPGGAFLRTHVVPLARPYMLLTSQWQQWSLFSPNPLRRISRMAVEANHASAQSPRTGNAPGGWYTVLAYDHTTVPWWRRANILKMMTRIEEAEDNVALRERLLLLACTTEALPPGTAVRLHRYYYVLPQHETPASFGWWHDYAPDWYDDILATTFCPPS